MRHSRKLILMRFGVNERHTPSDVEQFAAMAIVSLFLFLLLAFVGVVLYAYGPTEGMPVILLASAGLVALLISIAKGGPNAQD